MKQLNHGGVSFEMNSAGLKTQFFKLKTIRSSYPSASATSVRPHSSNSRTHRVWKVKRRRRRKFWGNTPLIVRKRCLEPLPKSLNPTTPTGLISPLSPVPNPLISPNPTLISLFPQNMSKIRLFPQPQLTPPHPRGGIPLYCKAFNRHRFQEILGK